MCSSGVFGANEDEMKSVSVMEGDSVTLNPELTQIQDIIKKVWRFSDKDPNIAETSKHEFILSESNEMFRDRLQLDHQTGSLTIKNTRTTDSGLYELQIDRSNGTSYKKFNVTVYGEDTFLVSCIQVCIT